MAFYRTLAKTEVAHDMDRVGWAGHIPDIGYHYESVAHVGKSCCKL
jgi:hypothetical protein